MKFIILLIAIIAFACNDASKHEHNSREAAATTPKTLEDSLYAEVDEAHIVGMAKMGKLKGAIAEVKKALDSVNKLPKSKLDETYQQSLIDLQEDLNYADYFMDTWMKEFKADSAKGNPEARIKYLQSEKDKVTKMRDNILNGIQRADSLLKK
jgi:hypothetical protein